jgi:uncharacterized protein (TIGR01777 family)
MKKIVITGGTGFLGKAIAQECVRRGHSVVIISRGSQTVPGCTLAGWDALHEYVYKADVVINLAGSSVGGQRWTSRVRHEIHASRIESTRSVVEAIRASPTAPCLINASAVGFYGNTMIPSSEAMGSGSTFLAVVTSAWEREAFKASAHTRVVCLRIGVVLDCKQGALPKMLLPIKLFVGGVLGTGRQWLPWVHVHDVVQAFIWALEKQDLEGPVNLVAPEAVTMQQFTEQLSSVLHRPAWLPVPGFVLRLMLGRQADVVLHGQHVIPNRLLGSDFTFKFPSLRKALEDLLTVR